MDDQMKPSLSERIRTLKDNNKSVMETLVKLTEEENFSKGDCSIANKIPFQWL